MLEFGSDEDETTAKVTITCEEGEEEIEREGEGRGGGVGWLIVTAFLLLITDYRSVTAVLSETNHEI